MPRKTASYLHRLQADVAASQQRLAAIAADLEQQSFELASYSLEGIRIDSAESFNQSARDLDKVRLEYGKELKILHKAVQTFREFF